MSTPITPSGAPTRYRPELSFASPVNQTTPVEPTRGDGGRNLNQRPTDKLKTNNGRRGPTAGVVLALQTFVQEFGLLVGIARMEEIQAIQKVSPRVTDRSEGEDALPPHLISVLDAATELTRDQRARAAALLAKHVNTFPARGLQ